MKKSIMSVVALTAIMGSVNMVSANDGINILNNIKLKGEIRPRFETADVVDNGKDAAQSLTARTHLTMTGGLFGVDGLTSTIGLQSVNNFGGTNYNSTQNGNTKYDVIADPNLAMLSEASIDYKLGENNFHAGRSQVNLDNQRFIGTVGWRQLERSYDTLYVTNSSIKGLNVLAAYIYGFAGVKSVTTTESNSVLLHAKYKVSDALNITVYDYMLSSIHDTYGLALTGKADVGVKLNYRAEYAVQSDPTMEYRVKDVKADAEYINLDLGANMSGILAGLNYESLSGADASGKTKFTTPLATGHKFNGWADVFLATPSGGLVDVNARLGYKTKDFGKLLAVYHSFTSRNTMVTPTGTSNDLGTEIDAVYVNKISAVKGLKGLLKFAAYSKGAISGYTHDKQVMWAQLDYKF